MSISRVENQAKKSLITKDVALPVINIGKTIGNLIKAFPKNPLDFILIFTISLTAIGELFGRNYSWRWYVLIIFIITLYTIRELVEPREVISGEPREITNRE